jgi:thiol-disulfide isomerase/thioredoxin
MLHKLKLLCCCLLTVLLMSCTDKDNQSFHDTEGKTVQLSSLKGKWVIVNYWASWCDNCIKEIPELNHFNKNHLKDAVIVGVNFNQLPLDMLKKAIETAKISFPVLTEDPGKAWRLDDVSVLPTTFILNPQGKLVKVVLGGSTEKSLTAILQQLAP